MRQFKGRYAIITQDFYREEKFMKMGRAGHKEYVYICKGIFADLLSAAADELTDGVVYLDKLSCVQFLTKSRRAKAMNLLVEYGLISRDGNEVEVKKYLFFNISRAEIETEKKRKAQNSASERESKKVVAGHLLKSKTSSTTDMNISDHELGKADDVLHTQKRIIEVPSWASSQVASDILFLCGLCSKAWNNHRLNKREETIAREVLPLSEHERLELLRVKGRGNTPTWYLGRVTGLLRGHESIENQGQDFDEEERLAIESLKRGA